MKIALIYDKHSEATTGAYIEKVIRQARLEYSHFGISQAVQAKEKFDLYLRIDHGDYKYDLPEQLRPAVFYAIDTHLPKPYKKISRQAKHYDVIFCAQKQGAIRLKREIKADAHWLPLACDPQIHCKLDIPKIYDVGFVGRDAKKFARGRQLVLLRQKYPDSFIGEADFREMNEIYGASRVGFNSSIINDINMRLFEVMSSGAFLLTNHIRDNGLEDIFEDGKHLVTYKNDRDLLEKLQYFLAHQAEREKIAAAGHEAVLNSHTYFHRVQTMFNYLAFKFGGEFNKLRI